MTSNAPTMGGAASMPSPPNMEMNDVGDKAGSSPQPGGGSPVRPTNFGPGGDRRGGTMPLGGNAPTISPPNGRTAPIGHSSTG